MKEDTKVYGDFIRSQLPKQNTLASLWNFIGKQLIDIQTSIDIIYSVCWSHPVAI